MQSTLHKDITYGNVLGLGLGLGLRLGLLEYTVHLTSSDYGRNNDYIALNMWALVQWGLAWMNWGNKHISARASRHVQELHVGNIW